MAFNQFPYSNFHELNLDWVVNKVKEFNERLDSITDTILKSANAYTDKQIQTYFTQFVQEMETMREDFEKFTQIVNANLTLFQTQIDQTNANVTAGLKANRAYTDTAIEQNNAWLLKEVSDNISNVLPVYNPFTGVSVTVQEIVDYLSALHMTNAISYTELAQAKKTVTQMIAINATYTQLAINGKLLIN